MKPVLVALADMADESHTCYPGQQKLAEMTGLSPKTVQRALTKLEAIGALTREHRHGQRGYRTSDRYVLNLDLEVTLPTGHSAYKAESLQGTVSGLEVTVSSPTGHSDRAEENHQYEPLEEPLEGDVVSERDIPAGTTTAKSLPRPFIVTSQMKDWAARETPSVDVVSMSAEFVRYWREGEGKGKRKKNWPLTWMNWARRQQSDAPAPAPVAQRLGGPGGLTSAEYRQQQDDRAEAMLKHHAK